MKLFRILAALLMVFAVLSLSYKAGVSDGLFAALAVGAVAFWIGCHLLDTNWTPRARCCTNDISMTGLTEILFKARDQVCDEPCGFAQGVIVNGGAEGASIGGTITSLRTQEPTLITSYTPAMTVPAASDITTAVESMTIDGVAGTAIPLKGETFLKLANTVGAEMALQQLYAQGLRKIRNTIEAAIGTAAKNGASRATGTAGTTPFASNHNSINALRQILEDNGAPVDDGGLSLVISTTAGTNLRNLTQLTKANESGSTDPLRKGELLNISGFSIRTSAGVASHTKGTGTGYLINNGNIAVGSVALTLDTGSGTIVAGDVLTHASDSTNKYVVGTALASNVVTLNYPGLRVATANDDAVTVGNSYTGNIGFHKSAIELAMRPPALPPGGDVGEEIATLVDEKTGLSFSARLYKGDGMNIIRILVFYGIKVWKPEFVATLLG